MSKKSSNIFPDKPMGGINTQFWAKIEMNPVITRDFPQLINKAIANSEKFLEIKGAKEEVEKCWKESQPLFMWSFHPKMSDDETKVDKICVTGVDMDGKLVDIYNGIDYLFSGKPNEYGKVKEILLVDIMRFSRGMFRDEAPSPCYKLMRNHSEEDYAGVMDNLNHYRQYHPRAGHTVVFSYFENEMEGR